MRKLLAFMFVCLLALPLAAQMRTGNLYGTVVDGDGVPLPGVNVTLTSTGGAPMTATTSNEGVFRFLSLPPSGNYEIKAELQGFKTKIEKVVRITIGQNTNMTVVMEMGAIEEEVTVIATTPTVTPKRTEVSHSIDRETMMALPSARDPWVVIQMVPSVLMDRENIGGSDSGQQSSFVSKGEGTDSWVMDGIQITDLTSTSSPTYFDFDIFEEISVTTGMPDVENRERAIVVNMVTRRGQNKFGFGGRFFMTDEAWQANPSGDDAMAVKEVFPEPQYPAWAGTNIIKNIKDFGFNMGGPLVQDKVWWWMSYGVQNIQTFVITGSPDNTQLNNYAGKLNFQLLPDNRAEIFLHLGDKKKQGRSSSTYNPAGVNQHGKYHFGSPIFKIQDEHMFGDNLFVSARYGFTDAGFGTWPGTDEDMKYARWYDYDNAIYNDPWGNLRYSSYYFCGRPHQFGLLQGIYYNDNLLGGSHEVKVGLEVNNNQRSYVGGRTGNFYFYHNYYSPQIDSNADGSRTTAEMDNWIRFNVSNNDILFEDGTDRYAGYVQDIITFGRLTFNLQFRMDREIDYRKEYVTRGLYLEDVEGDWHDNYYEETQYWLTPAAITGISNLMTDRTSPEMSTPDYARQWTVSPRIGMTYDLMGDGKTILKAAFAMYPGGPPGVGYYTKSGVYPWVRYWWADQATGTDMNGNPIAGNGDWKVQPEELYWSTYGGSRMIYPVYDANGNFIVSDAAAKATRNRMWGGFQWDTPNALTPNYATVDPDMKFSNDFDILIALEREIFADFGVGIDFTYRWNNNAQWSNDYYPQYDNDGVLTSFGEDALTGDFPTNMLDHVRSQDDYEVGGVVPGTIPTGDGSFSTDQAAGRNWYVLKDEPWTQDTDYSFRTNRPDYYTNYMGVDIRWNKRYSNNWMLSGSLTLQTQKQFYGDAGWLNPTNLWSYDGDYYTNSMGGGSGKLSVPMFTRWMFKLQGMYSLPLGIDVSFSLSGREGMIIDQFIGMYDYDLPHDDSYSANVQMQVNSDQARLGNVWVMNSKVQKRLVLGDTGSVWISCDIFNTLNNQVLNRQRANDMGNYYVHNGNYIAQSRTGEPNEVVNPLVLRFGVRFQF
ncbi:carboxypeptidase regulatory-like domain-containing protein [Acidobacteriota bacterium]